MFNKQVFHWSPELSKLFFQQIFVSDWLTFYADWLIDSYAAVFMHHLLHIKEFTGEIV